MDEIGRFYFAEQTEIAAHYAALAEAEEQAQEPEPVFEEEGW